MSRLYYINPNYSLILKKNLELLVVSNNSKILKYKLNKEEFIFFKDNINKECFSCSNSNIIFNKLLRKHVFIEKEYDNYDFNSYIYLKSFNKKIKFSELKEKRVLVLGLGGVGCEVIKHLVGLGIKNYIIIDFDTVNLSNFNRQYIFQKNDVGKYKTDVIYEYIRNNINDSNIIKYNKRIDNDKDLYEILDNEKIDMIICAADTPFLNIRINTIKASIKYNIPCIFGGVNVFDGTVGPLLVNKKCKLNYLKELNDICNYVETTSLNKASFGPTNSIISSYMINDIIMFFIKQKKYVMSLNKIKNFKFFE